MSEPSSKQASKKDRPRVKNVPPEYDEYWQVTQADMDRAKFRIELTPVSGKRQIKVRDELRRR
jgi:hypothetical protein